MITYKITAVPSRKEMLIRLKNRLDLYEEDIIYDDRPGGGSPFYTVKKAWLQPLKEGETHRLILNEDVDVCEGFKNICEKIVATHPDCIINLFTTRFNGKSNDEFINTLDTPYIYHNGIFGCAVIIPSKYIQECFEYIDRAFDDTVQESIGFHNFASCKNIPIITTVPTLVQHLGDESLFDSRLPIRRSERFEVHPVADWSNKKIVDMPIPEWFKPKRSV